MNLWTPVLAGLLLSAVFPVQASDSAREKRLADEIVDSILDGEPVYLDAGPQPFLGIDTEPAGTEKGSVIILHGRGYHPDWEDVAHPLRIGLAEQGWRTLSLQMPVLAKDAKYYDYVPILPEAFPRIEAGIDYLESRSQHPIILIAHSCGVHMAMAWLETRGAADHIDAFVGIGMGATDYQQPMAHPFRLERLSIPVLDVFGSDDYPAVIRNADRRLLNIARGSNPLSEQMVIQGADHYFHDMGAELTVEIGRWLSRLPAQTARH